MERVGANNRRRGERGIDMANEQNLVPMNKRSKSEAREAGRKGGIASGKKRKEKIIFKELFQELLSGEYKDGMTNAEAIVSAQLLQALEGNTKAFEVIRDTIGQKPVDKAEDKISGAIQISWSEEK